MKSFKEAQALSTFSHVIDISAAKDDTDGFHLKSYLINKK